MAQNPQAPALASQLVNRERQGLRLEMRLPKSKLETEGLAVSVEVDDPGEGDRIRRGGGRGPGTPPWLAAIVETTAKTSPIPRQARKQSERLQPMGCNQKRRSHS